MGSVDRTPHKKCLRTRTCFSCALASRPKRSLGSDGEFVPSKKADLHPCSMNHFHPFRSSRSILQLARILSVILLAKFSCAVHVKGTGLAAEAFTATGYEPNDITKENDSAVTPTLISKRALLVLCCRQFL